VEVLDIVIYSLSVYYTKSVYLKDAVHWLGVNHCHDFVVPIKHRPPIYRTL